MGRSGAAERDAVQRHLMPDFTEALDRIDKVLGQVMTT